MNKEIASVWAQNNGGTTADRLPQDILQENNEKIIVEFLRGLYWSQDYGNVMYLECDTLEFANGVKNLWNKLNIKVDIIMPLYKYTGIRQVIRPTSLLDYSRMEQILW